MSKNKKESFFWTSYSDLMTSLFFVMLVLFILTVVMLKNKSKANQYIIDKITAIQNSVNKIDTTYFEYREEYKKHILKISVQFDDMEDNIYSSKISQSTRDSLKSAGDAIISFLDKSNKDTLTKDAKFLLVIEGQASKDGYWDNDGLSYRRALALKYFWLKNGISLNNRSNCEVIVAGSGIFGTPREKKEELNKRFLIHIIPKPGIGKNDSKN